MPAERKQRLPGESAGIGIWNSHRRNPHERSQSKRKDWSEKAEQFLAKDSQGNFAVILPNRKIAMESAIRAAYIGLAIFKKDPVSREFLPVTESEFLELHNPETLPEDGDKRHMKVRETIGNVNNAWLKPNGYRIKPVTERGSKEEPSWSFQESESEKQTRPKRIEQKQPPPQPKPTDNQPIKKTTYRYSDEEVDDFRRLIMEQRQKATSSPARQSPEDEGRS